MKGDKREYKLAADPYVVPSTGAKVREILRLEDGRREVALVVADEYAMDVRAGLEIAHGDGRWARSEEILGDEGLARAAAEVGKHEPYLHMSGLACDGDGCDYHDPEADGEKWHRHVAYAILQAAARTP